MSVSVWVKPLLGQWTPIGEADYPRVLPSSVHLEADEWGPLQGTLTLDLGPRLSVPAFLVQYASAYVEIDGARVWSGLVRKLDRQDRLVTVNLQGSQMRLDDPVSFWSPVDNRLSSWSGDLCQSGPWTTSSSQQVGTDSIVLSWTGTALFQDGFTNPNFNAVTYMAQQGRMAALLIAFSPSQTVSGLHFGVYVHGEENSPLDTGWAPVSTVNVSGGQQTLYTTFTANRYVSVGLYNSPATTSVPANFSCTISAIIALEGSGYYANNNSTFHGSDAASRLTGMVPGISADVSAISATPAQIPVFAYEQGAPPRQLLSDAAQYDDSLCKIDAYDRIVFAPRPTGPTVELGGVPVSETPADPSTSVAAVEIASQDANGQPQRRTVTLLDVPEAPRQPATATFVNPDFGTDTSGWTISNDANGRDQFLVSSVQPPPGYAGSASWSRATLQALVGGSSLATTLTGTLAAGVPAAVSFWCFSQDPIPPGAYVDVWLYDNGNRRLSLQFFRVWLNQAASAPWPWTQYTFSFVPQQTWLAPTFALYLPDQGQQAALPYLNGMFQWPAAIAVLVTGFRCWQVAGTFTGLARVGTLDVPTTASDSQLLSLGQTYLRAYNRLGYTGERDVPDGGARDAASHAPLPAASLLATTGTYARLADRIDPADGKVGAMAYISQVAYEHSSRRAAVTVGQRYTNVDELMTRITNPRTRIRGRRR